VRSFGYRTQVFGSGEDLLSAGAAAQAACLLLDVRMPGLSGLDVAARACASAACTFRSCFFTALASDDEERRAREAGAVAFLRKPLAEAKAAPGDRARDRAARPRGRST
jgi:FixJ family two-component response regulator